MKAKLTLLAILMLVFVQMTYAQNAKKIDAGAIIRQFHTNYSNGEVEKNGALVDDNVIIDINGGSANQPNGETFKGREAFVTFLKRDKKMFSDGKITHLQLIQSGNEAAVRFYMEGTHTGPIPTPNGILEPTGKKIRLEVTEFATFDDNGKLLHVHTLYNSLGLIMQLTAK
ncbi:MAG: ester cyclase [Mucilaginibacter sp.]|uniref:ester cyclase n=1 Tax=Mucilaginibacter sp. TaxID=1882438 RepID=UPI003265AB38